MTKQLNLRVDESFAAAIERLANKLGRPMASVLETVGWPAIEAAEADLQFEAEALVAWEEYELTGIHVSSTEIESLFDGSLQKAANVLRNRGDHEEGSDSNAAV
jgi:predicted transcriptional regulator